MHADDPERAAILARRQRFILLALTGASVPATTACSRAQPCLSIYDPEYDRDPVTTVCPAELEPPVSLLNGTQMRLPDGMTPEAIIELAPDLVRLSLPVESVSCIGGWPGGFINYFAMTVVADDPSKPMPVLRDQLLASFGYTAPSFSAEVNDEVARSYEVVLDQTLPSTVVEDNPLQAPPENETNTEPARAFLRLVAHEGRIYAVIYEVHPNAWNALQASLRASAASISFTAP